MNRLHIRLIKPSIVLLVVTALLAIGATAVWPGLWTGSVGAQSSTTVSLTPNTVTVREGGTAEFTVTVSPAPEADLNMTYTIGVDEDAATADADADDYTASGVVTIPAGEAGAETSSGVISISVTDDSDIDDGTREFMVVRLGPSTGAMSDDPVSGYPSARLTIEEGVCDRTGAVQNEIVTRLSASDCWSVTDFGLGGITELDLTAGNIGQIRARDFLGLSGLRTLKLHERVLRSLPAGARNYLGGVSRLEVEVHGESLGDDFIQYLQRFRT